MEREELERYTVKKWVHSEWEIVPDENGEFFWVEDVNPVLERMEARIKELEGENEKLKAQFPKWVSVKDRLPSEKEQHKLLWVAYIRKDNTIKYMHEALFEYETKQFYTENDWGDKTFIEPSIWMVVPLPTTEESSETDNDQLRTSTAQ